MKSYSARLWRTLQYIATYVLCGLLIQAQIAAIAYATSEPVAPLPAEETFRPFAPATTVEEAQVTIKAADQRPAQDAHGLPNFSGANADAEFESLIQANVIAKFIDDPENFQKWWRVNKDEEMKHISEMGDQTTWQTFLANVYIKYKLIDAQKKNDPSAVLTWMRSVSANPIVRTASSWTVWFVVGTSTFMGGLLFGALASGPVGGWVNNYLNPIVKPFQDKAGPMGTKHWGWLNKRLNSMLLDEKLLAKDGDDAKSAVNEMRSLVAGRDFTIDPEKWAQNYDKIRKLWNHLNNVWAKMPDAYKNGRDRGTDFIMFRPRDFANSVTTSMSAAETHMQSAEQMLDRIIARGAPAADVDRIGSELRGAVADQIRNEGSPVGGINQRVSNLQSELARVGATPEQVERVTEAFRRSMVFTRQAATVLAVQQFHDANFSDTMAQVRQQIGAFRDNYATEYFRTIFAEQIKGILNAIDFDIDVNIKLVQSAAAAKAEGKSGSKVLELIKPTIESQEGIRATNEPGSSTRADKDATPEERVKEAVRGAGRR